MQTIAITYKYDFYVGYMWKLLIKKLIKGTRASPLNMGR